MKATPRRARLSAVISGSLLGGALLLPSSPATAQAAPRPGKPSSSLLSELGTAAVERLLASDTSSQRLRAFLRLSALATPRAVELLARALDPGGAAHGAEEHLAAVRALAPHAKSPVAREALVRALSSPPEVDAGPLSDWVRSAAALALAQSRDPAALSALGRALRKPGLAAELAKQALLQNPPADLAPLLQVPGAPTKELCQALGALGDQRAEGFLREIVRRGAPEARAAAALALLELGSSEVIDLARHWLRSERQPTLLAAAAEILARRGQSDAAGPLAELAESDATRELALDLVLRSDGLVAVPAALSASVTSERGGALLEILARSGAGGAPRIEQALLRPETAGLAIYALSRTPGGAAQGRLERALSDPKLRAFAVRALALRAQRLGSSSDVVSALLPSLLQAAAPSERAAAAFASGLLQPSKLPELLASSDPLIVRAAARLSFSGKPAQAAVQRLTGEPDAALRSALSIGLADPVAAELVPTPLLLELSHAGGPGSLLALAALAARKDSGLLPLIRELLASGDPWQRAHTLLGLSRASEPDVLGVIEGAYRFEPDPNVRHAAVVALSRRPEPVKQRTLRLAAELDSSRLVREAARLALSGQELGDGLLGSEQVWLQVSKSPGLEAALLPAAFVRVGYGLALPVLADPDGLITLAGIDPAPVDVRLALLGQQVFLPGASP
jgi:hypothetical protein